MNFVLSMFGQIDQDHPWLRDRPPGRHPIAEAAALAARGQFAAAAQAYAPPRGERRRQAWRHATCAQLLLLANDPAAAERAFARASAILLRESSRTPQSGVSVMNALDDFPDSGELRGTTLQRLAALAAKNLRARHYPRAVTLFERALVHVDVLLATTAGRIVSTARRTRHPAPAQAEPLVALARLGDALLRSLSRAHLAENLAESLRQRSSRDDLALWATGAESVQRLLQMQFNDLHAASREHPSTIELHYRTGLVARALGRLEEARQAFARVLRLHPHHLGAAARLAATGLELEQLDQVMPVLAVALAVPDDLLNRYRALGQAAENPAHFDQAVEALIARSGPTADPASIRANLAFALSELGLLDAAHAHWRNPMQKPIPAAA